MSEKLTIGIDHGARKINLDVSVVTRYNILCSYGDFKLFIPENEHTISYKIA